MAIVFLDNSITKLTPRSINQMKTTLVLFFLLFFCCYLPEAFSQDLDNEFLKIKVEESSRYLPDYLADVYIGMPLIDFENIKDTTLINIHEYSSPMWIEINESVVDNGIDEILYKFDKEEDGVNIEEPLYQINIKFLDQDDKSEYINQKFGEPFKHDEENRNEWIFRTNKDYMLIIKEYEDTVQIIATMAGTEWDTNK